MCAQQPKKSPFTRALPYRRIRHILGALHLAVVDRAASHRLRARRQLLVLLMHPRGQLLLQTVLQLQGGERRAGEGHGG